MGPRNFRQSWPRSSPSYQLATLWYSLMMWSFRAPTSKPDWPGLAKLRRFLEVVRSIGMTLNQPYRYLATTFDYLGHTISDGCIRPGAKTAAIENLPTPQNVHQVRQFIGLTGYFRKFVRNYASLLRSITDLLKTDVPFGWSPAAQDAAERVKKISCSQPLLVLYDGTARHQVHTDASSAGLAAILMQSSDGQDWRPVCYFSRQTSEAESRYHSYELDTLTVVAALERFRFYLLGKKFEVVTDCQAVVANRANKQLNARVARWWLKLQEYDFELVHRGGAKMTHVDALSRNPVEPPTETEIAHLQIQHLHIDDADWVVSMQRQDDKLKEIVRKLQEVPTTGEHRQLRKDYSLKNHRLFRR